MTLDDVFTRIDNLIGAAKLRSAAMTSRKRTELAQGISMYVEQKLGELADYYTTVPQTIESDLIDSGTPTRVFYEYDVNAVTCYLANDRDIVAQFRVTCTDDKFVKAAELEAFVGAAGILKDERDEQIMLRKREQREAQNGPIEDERYMRAG